MESSWAIVEPHSVSIIIGILMNAMMFIHTSMNALCPMRKPLIRVLYHPNNSLSSIYHPQAKAGGTDDNVQAQTSHNCNATTACCGVTNDLRY